MLIRPHNQFLWQVSSFYRKELMDGLMRTSQISSRIEDKTPDSCLSVHCSDHEFMGLFRDQAESKAYF